MKTPDWNLWQHLPDAELWEAVLLSMNIDPGQIESEYGSYHEYFREDKEASKRLRLLDANRYRIYPLGIDRLIRLDRFAAWASTLWEDLPPELLALACKQAAATEQNDVPTAGNTPPTSKIPTNKAANADETMPWWREDYDIMLLASNAGDSLQRQKKRTSNRAIGDAIANRIEAEESRGKKRKPPTGEHIKNTALKGWQYKPN